MLTELNENKETYETSCQIAPKHHSEKKNIQIEKLLFESKNCHKWS